MICEMGARSPGLNAGDNYAARLTMIRRIYKGYNETRFYERNRYEEPD